MPSPFRSIQNTARVVDEAAHPWQGANRHDVDVALAAMGVLMASIESSEIAPSEAVAHGPVWWRQVFMRGMRGYRLVDEACADLTFQEIVKLHNHRYPGVPASVVLDAWLPYPVITQADIDAGWEIESDSTEEARRFFYGDKHPKEVLRQLCDPKADDALVVR